MSNESGATGCMTNLGKRLSKNDGNTLLDKVSRSVGISIDRSSRETLVGRSARSQRDQSHIGSQRRQRSIAYLISHIDEREVAFLLQGIVESNRQKDLSVRPKPIVTRNRTAMDEP